MKFREITTDLIEALKDQRITLRSISEQCGFRVPELCLIAQVFTTYHLPPEDGEDLFSAARLRLIANYDKIDFQHPAHDAYIKSLIANTCRTELGKILKHHTQHISLDAQPPDADETWADRLPDTRTIAQECVPMQLVADAAMRGIENPSHRRMVRMHMAGVNNREIAERVRHKNGRAYTHQTVSIIIGRWKRSARQMAGTKRVA